MPQPFQLITCTPESPKARNVHYEDLPVLNWFRNPTTGKSTVCGHMSLAHVTIQIATLPQEAAIRDVTTTWTSLPTMWW
jgi:hypothetical protein